MCEPKDVKRISVTDVKRIEHAAMDDIEETLDITVDRLGGPKGEYFVFFEIGEREKALLIMTAKQAAGLGAALSFAADTCQAK